VHVPKPAQTTPPDVGQPVFGYTTRVAYDVAYTMPSKVTETGPVAARAGTGHRTSVDDLTIAALVGPETPNWHLKAVSARSLDTGGNPAPRTINVSPPPSRTAVGEIDATLADGRNVSDCAFDGVWPSCATATETTPLSPLGVWHMRLVLLIIVAFVVIFAREASVNMHRLAGPVAVSPVAVITSWAVAAVVYFGVMLVTFELAITRMEAVAEKLPPLLLADTVALYVKLPPTAGIGGDMQTMLLESTQRAGTSRSRFPALNRHTRNVELTNSAAVTVTKAPPDEAMVVGLTVTAGLAEV